jgi:hypothetical protein
VVLLTQFRQLEYSHYKHSKKFWNENITRKICADALLGQEPIRCKISVNNKCNKTQQVNSFKYLGCGNSYVNHKDNQQKLAKFPERQRILKNNFKPTLVKKISRIKVHNTLDLPIVLHGGEIWSLRKKDEKRLTSIEIKFFRTAEYILFNHKKLRKFLRVGSKTS